MIERVIGAKTLELDETTGWATRWRSRRWCGFADEELKHQEMFRRLEEMAALGMPSGYTFVPEANEVAQRSARHVRAGRCSR